MNDNTTPLLPKLRFPEFKDAGEWELKPFAKFIKLYRGSSPRPIKEYLTQSENGVNWIKIGDTSPETDFIIRNVSEKITPKGAEKSREVKKGELILANSMSYGSTYQLGLNGCIYDGWFVLREYEGVFDKQFLLQLLNSSYMQEQYKKFAAGGIVQNISSEIVYSTLLPKTSIEEQQKIADCLSSLDKLIAAHTKKYKALQSYKKGLMQNLFPAEGETVPKLRFSEFDRAGNWLPKQLGIFLNSYSERVSSVENILPVYSSTREGLKSQKEYYDGRELINEGEYGVVPVGYFVYRHMSDDTIFKFNINNTGTSIAVSKEYPVFRTLNLNSKFLLYKLNGGTDFRRFSESQRKGGTRTRLYFKTLCSWITLLPCEAEQQKIANCLSSLDDLIAAQAQKIESLKAHKKGLMQQLFPAVDEVGV